MEEYLNLLQEVYPISPKDFEELEQKVKDAVKNGPQLHVACKRARLAGLSKRENLRVVAFIQGREDKQLEAEVDIHDLTQAGNSEVSLDLAGDLLLPRPGAEVCLRVEVRKAKSGKIIGHAETSLSDISGAAHKRWCQLQTRDRRFSLLSPHKEDAAELADGLNEVEIELWKTSFDPHCSEEVPRLLAEFLWERAERILRLQGSKLPVDDGKKTTYSLHVERTEGKEILPSSHQRNWK